MGAGGPASPGFFAVGKAPGPETQEWERQWCMFTHLSGFASLIIPLGGIIGPLVMWLIKREQSPFVDDHGKEAVNFQISILIYTIALVAIGFITCGIGFVLLLAPVILAVVGIILGSIAANKGEYFRYPATLRLIR
jgi:uncharacterized Tic20 family protein